MNRTLQFDSDLSAIAVVGMAGRFPGAGTLSEFWTNLSNGVESISPLTDGQLLAEGVDPALLRDPRYVKAAAVLDGIDLFDASFFGFSPRDAAIMDPQHRVFLECAWHALEDAGWSADQFPGRIGVYAGSGMNSYLLFNLLPNRALMESAGLFLLRQTGNDKDVLATRVSYQMNLTGPSLTVQTACSTSLVAVHLACQSLIAQECDMALAGGVTIEIPHKTGYLYREGEILSRDGHCRAFDASSSGTVFGSGAGVVVLRRLADALAGGDNIQAVIRGTAINNDGARKVGYLAPSVSGQSDVVLEALAVAGVDAESISYIETHGTGTAVGDPIEIAALTQAYRKSTQKRGFCRIGSLKTNIGHLDAAAGVAGLIKTVLSLRHKQLPASLHFSKPNPAIDFESSPFLVNDRLSPWDTDGAPRRAGVTSLGIGGTNAHVIVEEAPPPEESAPSRPWQILTLSAKTPRALEAAAANLAGHFAAHPDVDLADAAYTCHLGRKEFAHRRAVLCQSLEDAVQSLRAEAHGREANPAPIVFLFPGQGSQYVNMARGIYETEPEFRSQVDLCAEFLKSHLGLDLRTVLFAAGEQLDQTWLTQPALFVIEWALAKLWMSWGIRPDAMIGHSIGELVAAAIAGVFSLEDALTAVAARGRLMQSAPPGAMLAARLSEQEALPLADSQISLAAVNSPSQCVFSGSLDAIAQLEHQLLENKTIYRRLKTSHGFHSAGMDRAAAEFEGLLRGFALKAPEIPFISNVSGDWIKPEEAGGPGYWALQMRKTVRFYDGFRALSGTFTPFFALECGPGRVLSGLTGSMGGDDPESVIGTLGRLWAAGAKVDWAGFHAHERRHRVSLPGYPFERQRFWIDAPKAAPTVEIKPEPWYYKPVWKRLPPLPAPKDESSLEAEIATALREAGSKVVTADARRIFVLNPGFDQLLSLAQGLKGEVDLCLISNGLQSVNGEPVRHPEQALLFGPGKVIPKEFPNIRCKCIDVLLNEPSELPRIARQIVAEMSSPENRVIAYRGEERWEQTLERTRLDPAPSGSRLRPRGIYIITGGLGGIGLAIAEYLAREIKAKLVLMGRREPGEAALRKIRDLEALGAEVLAVRGDVTSLPDLRHAIGEARQRFGTIHGVVHAAGVLDDGVIALKSRESAGRVLAPKVQGTLALKEALEGIPLDFLVLFSSISSFTAPAGQVDYVAANSFLDAFANASRAENKTWTVAIDWPKWRNLGMARRVNSGGHPLLGRCTVNSPDTLIYENSLNCDDLWVLNEHRLRGADALFPGTGYIELARAAMRQRFGEGAIQVRDLAFQAPLSVPAGGSRPIQMKLAKNGHGDSFAFSTVLRPASAGKDEPPGIASATARVRYLGPATPKARNVKKLLSRCSLRRLSFGVDAQNPKQAEFIEFGPRWRCLKEVRFGAGEAVSTLELAAEFSGDLDTFRSHPALLDAATGSAILTIPGYESARNLYIPVSYKSITLYSALPRKCYCHILPKPSNSIESESVAFDLALLDADGRAVAEIEEFVLRRMSGTAALTTPGAPSAPVRANARPAITEEDDGSIEPSMGVEAFAAILESDAPPQIVVTPPDWTFEPAQTEPGHPAQRVADSISWAPASDEIERTLTSWWKDLLGAENIGVRDNFFDLGGHSLLGLRLLAKIEHEFQQSIPLHALFETSTIESLAARIRRARPAHTSAIVAMNSDGASPGFYCVHALGGEVANFRHLAEKMKGVRKFYGIQTPPEMMTPEFASSIEAMAAHYVKDLLAFQPEGPILLGGWSSGSTIALEMARLLKEAGRMVELIVALDGAPFNTGTRTPRSSPVFYWKLLRNLPLWVADDLLADFSMQKLFRGARNKAGAFARTDAMRLRLGLGTHGFEVSSFLDTGNYSARRVSFMNAFFAAFQRYVPRRYSGRVLLYQARTEPLHLPFEVDRAWRGIASDVTVVRVPGSHLRLMAEPNVRLIAEDLRRVLAPK